MYILNDIGVLNVSNIWKLLKDLSQKVVTEEVVDKDNNKEQTENKDTTIQKKTINIINDLCSSSHTGGRRNVEYIKGVILHQTNNYNYYADAKWHRIFQDTSRRKVSWHYSVDDTGIYQNHDESEICYHSGNKEANRYTLGIELMTYKGMNKEEAISNLKLLVEYLSKKYDDLEFFRHDKFNNKRIGVCPKDPDLIRIIDYANSLR